MDIIALVKLSVLLLIVPALMVLERLRPVARRTGGWRRVGKNFTLAGGNALLSPLVIVPVTALAAAMAPSWRPSWADGGWFLLIDLILLDLLIYGWHRASHELPILWRFHEIHHLDRFLDVSSAVRFHFGEVILSASFRAFAVFVLDIPLLAVLIFDGFVLVFAAFQHSNVSIPARLERSLRWIIVTPSHHWVHHHRVRRDTDSNYGTVLTIWDRLFGSFSATPRTAEMVIGCEGREEKTLRGLVTAPFGRQE